MVLQVNRMKSCWKQFFLTDTDPGKQVPVNWLELCFSQQRFCIDTRADSYLSRILANLFAPRQTTQSTSPGHNFTHATVLQTTIDKTYECGMCDQSFPKKRQLAVHKRVHAGTPVIFAVKHTPRV
ncbi:uncharacterized protein LOC131682947 [Topomyia yanbarensis]|uniref:uncharacterized protein LOC131682947 n=1 Tax=Topomyia yanbarensis TaxID=2498891 RepID=UPI00273BE8F4|nr:uncharacterized protein LOC131682947 [Topomyia yanbarensis]